MPAVLIGLAVFLLALGGAAFSGVFSPAPAPSAPSSAPIAPVAEATSSTSSAPIAPSAQSAPASAASHPARSSSASAATPAPAKAPVVSPPPAPESSSAPSTAAASTTSTSTPEVTEAPPAPAAPAPMSFTVHANDTDADLTAITVPSGTPVSLTFVVGTQGTYYGGLEFKSPVIDSGSIGAGTSRTIAFTATQSFQFTPYWPSSGVVKPYRINVSVE